MDHSIKKCPSKTPVPSGRYWASEKLWIRDRLTDNRAETHAHAHGRHDYTIDGTEPK